MEFEFFSFLALALGTWVLITPGWRLAGLRSARGFLEDPLVEGAQVEDRPGINFWLPSWFGLSVIVALCWIWFFWGGSKLANTANTWLWPDLNGYIKAAIVLTLVFNTTWLIWLSIIDYKKTLFCVAAGTVGFILVRGAAFHWEGSYRFHFIGSVAVALTVASNVCRINSSERPQFSKFALSVAVAGAIAGILWIPKAFVLERFTADTKKYGFWTVFLKKNLFWKVCLIVGSSFRGCDVVALLLVRLAGGLGNLQEKTQHGWLWFRQKVAGSAYYVQI